MSDEKNGASPQDERDPEHEELVAEIAREMEFDEFVSRANLARYRAQTHRMSVLIDFVCAHNLALGEVPTTGDSISEYVDVEAGTGGGVTRAVRQEQERAILAAYRAITSLAKQSHEPAAKGKWSQAFTEGDHPADEDDLDLQGL